MDNQNTLVNQTVGASVAGNMTAGNSIFIAVNSPGSSSANTPTSNTPFCFGVPTPNRHFQGRRNTMEDIKNYFTNLPSQTVDGWERIVAIVGLGGMGKTEMACKIATGNREMFPNVAWINAETKQSAFASFRELAEHLGIPRKDTQVAGADVKLVMEVYRMIDSRDCGRVLLIFDNGIQLNSNGPEFGISEYLPKEELLNRRFPYIIITTQTHYWERDIKRVQVDALTEDESLDFYRSSFKLKAPNCNDEFKKLHQLLEGFPLVMNLMAAQIDYNPSEDFIVQLKQQISSYIDKLGKEQDKFLNEKMSRACSSNYNMTLSNVWQLTFKRIQEEVDGCEALELLYLISFLHAPIYSFSILHVFLRSSDCPHPPKKESEHRLKKLIRVLIRFYTVRIVYKGQDDEEGYFSQLGIHRLVRSVVRQQMEFKNVLERLLFYFASDYEGNFSSSYRSALEEGLQRSQLSQRALPYVGILACHGIPAASRIVEKIQPETAAARTIWRLYYLERGMRTLNENGLEVIRQLIALTESEKQPEDRQLFRDNTICLFSHRHSFQYQRDDGTQVPGYLHNLDGVQDLVAELILKVHSSQDSICKDINCNYTRLKRDTRLSTLTAQLLETFIDTVEPKSIVAVDVIADCVIAVFARLRYYDPKDNNFPEFLSTFWYEMLITFHSPPSSSQSRIAALKKSLWNRGLKTELIQTFGFISRCKTYTNKLDKHPLVMNLMDVCIDGMDLKDESVQEVISSISQMVTASEMEHATKYFSCDLGIKGYNRVLAVVLGSFLAKQFLKDDGPPSQNFLESLSQLKFLDWTETSVEFDLWMHFVRFDSDAIPAQYLTEYYPQFIQRFSSCHMKPIQRLVNLCRRLMEEQKKIIQYENRLIQWQKERSSFRLRSHSSSSHALSNQ